MHTRLPLFPLVLSGVALLISAVQLHAQPVSQVSTVNVTPTSFSVVWSGAPGATNAISISADPGGTTNLAGQVGLELYPLNTGDPSLTNAYQRRANQGLLRQQMAGLGLAEVRISGLTPGGTYYYQLQGSATNVPVTTPPENAFVLQSQQLVITLPATAPPGSFVLLANSNTPSLLAAVAGDGVASNQVYFSIGDLLAATGNTNYLPLGNQEFTATVLENSTNSATQTYVLNFTTDFLVAQENQFGGGTWLASVAFGSTIVPSGGSGSVPISLTANSLTNLSFTLMLPPNLSANVTLQSLTPRLRSASLLPSGSNCYVASFATFPGQWLQGTQPIARLNFTALSNQCSCFVPICPQSLSGANADGSPVSTFAVQPGRVVVLGPQPLLEATFAPGGTRNLSLYGIPGSSYELQRATNLLRPIAWTDFRRIPMTNLVQTFAGLDLNLPAVFYRACQFTADPPILEAHLAGQNRSLMLYGIPGTNYQLQFSTNLSGIVAWYPMLNCTLTNSFASITNLDSSHPAAFYRSRRP